jgi:hypothetical protein
VAPAAGPLPFPLPPPRPCRLGAGAAPLIHRLRQCIRGAWARAERTCGRILASPSAETLSSAFFPLFARTTLCLILYTQPNPLPPSQPKPQPPLYLTTPRLANPQSVQGSAFTALLLQYFDLSRSLRIAVTSDAAEDGAAAADAAARGAAGGAAAGLKQGQQARRRGAARGAEGIADELLRLEEVRSRHTAGHICGSICIPGLVIVGCLADNQCRQQGH